MVELLVDVILRLEPVVPRLLNLLHDLNPLHSLLRILDLLVVLGVSLLASANADLSVQVLLHLALFPLFPHLLQLLLLNRVEVQLVP